MVDNSNDNNVIIPVNYARNIINLRSDQIDPFIMVKAREQVPTQEMKEDLRGAMRSIRRIHPKEEDDFAFE